MKTQILHIIGKGQVTIPQQWRALLGIGVNPVKATLEGNKIVIQTIPLHEEKTWNTEIIALNTLSEIDKKIIREGRKAYGGGKKKRFLIASEFFRK